MNKTLPLLLTTFVGCAGPLCAQPAQTAKPAPQVQSVPLSLEDVTRLLGVNMWKWRLALPAQTKWIVFVRADYRKGEDKPKLMMIGAFAPLFGPGRRATDLHDVLVRWPDDQTKATTVAFDDFNSGIATSEDDAFAGRSFGWRVNRAGREDQKEVKLNEPFFLVRTAYVASNRYDGKEHAPGAEKTNDRTLSLMMFVTSEKTPPVPVWKDGKVVLQSVNAPR